MIATTRLIDDTKPADAVATPLHGLDIDFSELPPWPADDLEVPVVLRALAEALTGADLKTAEPMPEPLRRRAEEIRAGMWPELSIELAAAIAIVRDCQLHQRAPSNSRREWLTEHSPGLLSYLDTMADGGPAAWRTVRDRWMIQAQAMDLAGVQASARVPRYEHILRALKDMAAIGLIAVRKAEEEQRAEWELARKQAAAAAGLRPDQDEDQGGTAEGGSGGGQKAKSGAPVETEDTAEEVILTAAEIAAMGWGKPTRNTKEEKNDFTPPGGPKL
ncbi:hypothetical protein N1937_02075 [Rhizobium sp. WSM4643]|uniref:hypothetical protein n=1 Tax=Rhizobium sp. WSM4643 TaxID=3138253 RepID=UPI0021A41AA5|nr:hypothetical protein [Rhizobium leguminosarum]UWM76060.1 hypothetical protein N1937_02075 [Rhizobium leguminosarum bv. viciae]